VAEAVGEAARESGVADRGRTPPETGGSTTESD